MTTLWFACADKKTRHDFKLVCEHLGHQLTFFNDLLAAQKQLLSGECPAALIAFLDRNIQQDLKILESIRKRTVWQDVAILVVIPGAIPELMENIAALGIDGTVLLPFEPEQVDNELQKAQKRRNIFTSHKIN